MLIVCTSNLLPEVFAHRADAVGHAVDQMLTVQALAVVVACPHVFVELIGPIPPQPILMLPTEILLRD